MSEKDAREVAQEILSVLMQSLAEYSIVHDAEHLKELLTDPEKDPIFLHELQEDVLEVLRREW